MVRAAAKSVETRSGHVERRVRNCAAYLCSYSARLDRVVLNAASGERRRARTASIDREPRARARPAGAPERSARSPSDAPITSAGRFAGHPYSRDGDHSATRLRSHISPLLADVGTTPAIDLLELRYKGHPTGATQRHSARQSHKVHVAGRLHRDVSDTSSINPHGANGSRGPELRHVEPTNPPLKRVGKLCDRLHARGRKVGARGERNPTYCFDAEGAQRAAADIRNGVVGSAASAREPAAGATRTIVRVALSFG